MHVTHLTKTEEIDPLIPLLLQLRPQYSAEELKALIEVQRELGYQLVYVKDSDKVISVAGFAINQKLSWGRAIYVDDLITDEVARNRGAGKLLIDWIKSYAKDNHCQQVHLDSGVQRFDAHKFYLREGFKIASHHFSYDIDA
nr:GNAT family N-acetyltransferase [Thaumasiovibrio subtropicus]